MNLCLRSRVALNFQTISCCHYSNYFETFVTSNFWFPLLHLPNRWLDQWFWNFGVGRRSPVSLFSNYTGISSKFCWSPHQWFQSYHLVTILRMEENTCDFSHLPRWSHWSGPPPTEWWRTYTQFACLNHQEKTCGVWDCATLGKFARLRLVLLHSRGWLASSRMNPPLRCSTQTRSCHFWGWTSNWPSLPRLERSMIYITSLYTFNNI